MDQYIDDRQSFNRFVSLGLPAFWLGLLGRKEKENKETLKNKTINKLIPSSLRLYQF